MLIWNKISVILHYRKEKQQPVCLYACISPLYIVYYSKTVSVGVKEIAENGGVITGSAFQEKESVRDAWLLLNHMN